MKDHSEFIIDALSPKENEFIKTAIYFHDVFEQLI